MIMAHDFLHLHNLVLYPATPQNSGTPLQYQWHAAEFSECQTKMTDE